MNTITMFDLRTKGYKISVNHFRLLKGKRKYVPLYQIKDEQLNDLISATGGKTVVSIVDPKGVVVEGVSRCNDSDIFVKKLGVAKAMGRAWSNLLKEEESKNSKDLSKKNQKRLTAK